MLDSYSPPVSAGIFVDLENNVFYDGTDVVCRLDALAGRYRLAWSDGADGRAGVASESSSAVDIV